MGILELRILPPLAIARLGSSPMPLVNYRVELNETNPLGHRRILPAETLEIDRRTGRVIRSVMPKRVRFKDSKGRIHPVAPFLEVWARHSQSREQLVPLRLRAARQNDQRYGHVQGKQISGNRDVRRSEFLEQNGGIDHPATAASVERTLDRWLSAYPAVGYAAL